MDVNRVVKRKQLNYHTRFLIQIQTLIFNIFQFSDPLFGILKHVSESTSQLGNIRRNNKYCREGS